MLNLNTQLSAKSARSANNLYMRKVLTGLNYRHGMGTVPVYFDHEAKAPP
jgi:hypothetical protein